MLLFEGGGELEKFFEPRGARIPLIFIGIEGSKGKQTPKWLPNFQNSWFLNIEAFEALLVALCSAWVGLSAAPRKAFISLNCIGFWALNVLMAASGCQKSFFL